MSTSIETEIGQITLSHSTSFSGQRLIRIETYPDGAAYMTPDEALELARELCRRCGVLTLAVDDERISGPPPKGG